jgi:hypothetical protein
MQSTMQPISRTPGEDVQHFLAEQLAIQRAGVRASLASHLPDARLEAARERIRKSAEQLAAALSAVGTLDNRSEGTATPSSPPPCEETPAAVSAPFPRHNADDEPARSDTSAQSGDLHMDSLLALSTAAVGPMQACVELLDKHCPDLPPSSSEQQPFNNNTDVGSAGAAVQAALDEFGVSLNALHASARELRQVSAEEAQTCEACVDDLSAALQSLLRHVHDDGDIMGRALRAERAALLLTEQLRVLQQQG